MSATSVARDPQNYPRPIVVDNIRRKRKSASAEIIPFPADRRKHFVTNAFMTAADMPDEEAAEYFRSIVTRHQQRLEQIGVTPQRIAADVAALRNYFFA